MKKKSEISAHKQEYPEGPHSVRLARGKSSFDTQNTQESEGNGTNVFSELLRRKGDCYLESWRGSHLS